MGIWLAQRSKSNARSKAQAKDQTEITTSSDDAPPPLLQLPSEIYQQIFSHLQAQSLVSLCRTSRQLRLHAENDLLWARLLRAYLPPTSLLHALGPFTSYRHLYMSHHPYWFLAKYQIWFSDDPHIGKIMLVKFNPKRGSIEGYRLLADRAPQNVHMWAYNPAVIIHSFTPRVHLWLEDPILALDHEPAPFNIRGGWWDGEARMKVGRPGHNTSAAFFLSRDIPTQVQSKSMELWPPFTIPDMPRVRAVSQDKFRGRGHRPQKYEEISQTTFRLRQWSQFSIEKTYFGVRLGEEVSTWSTLDPVLYTPTKQKPYQGIFVGDYAGHGCEFLLVTQTDEAPKPPKPPRMSEYYQSVANVAVRDAVKTDSPAAATTQGGGGENPENEEIHHEGAIEAIKLTGDPNVPRGQHTFIADDIGPAAFIRVATEAPFSGARVVRSRGHVAARGFQNAEFLPSQLFLISPDKLAQYWVPFGHISFYDRVNIHQILEEVWETEEKEC